MVQHQPPHVLVPSLVGYVRIAYGSRKPKHAAYLNKTKIAQDGKKRRTTIRLSEGTSDWIEQWSPELFRKVGYGMAAGVMAVGALGSPVTGIIAAVPVGM